MKTHGVVIYNRTAGTETIKLFATVKEAQDCISNFKTTLSFLGITDDIKTYHFTVNTKENK